MSLIGVLSGSDTLPFKEAYDEILGACATFIYFRALWKRTADIFKRQLIFSCSLKRTADIYHALEKVFTCVEGSLWLHSSRLTSVFAA